MPPTENETLQATPRYVLHQGVEGRTFRIDTFTGETWVFTWYTGGTKKPQEWQPVKEPATRKAD